MPTCTPALLVVVGVAIIDRRLNLHISPSFILSPPLVHEDRPKRRRVEVAVAITRSSPSLTFLRLLSISPPSPSKSLTSSPTSKFSVSRLPSPRLAPQLRPGNTPHENCAIPKNDPCAYADLRLCMSWWSRSSSCCRFPDCNCAWDAASTTRQLVGIGGEDELDDTLDDYSDYHDHDANGFDHEHEEYPVPQSLQLSC